MTARTPRAGQAKTVEHTPGRWYAGRIRHAGGYQLVEIEGEAKGYVCEVQAPIVSGYFDLVERERRARLIAAAPELLAVVRDLEWSVQGDAEEGGHVPACPSCGGEKRHGHHAGCGLAAALALADLARPQDDEVRP